MTILQVTGGELFESEQRGLFMSLNSPHVQAFDVEANLHLFETTINYKFSDKTLFTEAMTHASASNEFPDTYYENNQRLEFLGDAVLGLIVADTLFHRFPENREGDLTKWRTALVRGKTLAEIALSLDLGSFLILGAGEEKSDGRRKSSNLSDSLEALIGAVYVDGGHTAARQFINLIYAPYVDVLETSNPKGDLQELAATIKTRPRYVLVEESGPEHEVEYRVRVEIELRPGIARDPLVAEGVASSKRGAETAAAEDVLVQLKEILN